MFLTQYDIVCACGIAFAIYFMHAEVTSTSPWIDSQQWINENPGVVRNCSMGPTELMYLAATYHPHWGCPYPLRDPPSLDGTESIEYYATLADIVAVACTDQVGYDTYDHALHKTIEGCKPPKSFEMWNQGSVGGMAYVALNHVNLVVRECALEDLKAWRRQYHCELATFPSKYIWCSLSQMFSGLYTDLKRY